MIGPTAVYHVPRNEALAKTEPYGVDAASHWSRYLAGWTAWNHLRFAGALAASAALTIALVSYAQRSTTTTQGGISCQAHPPRR